MAVPMDQSGGGSSIQDNGRPQKVQKPITSGTPLKEQEASALTDKEEGKIVAEIKTRAEALDSQALETVRTSIEEAKLTTPAPEIPADLEDAGVVHPQQEADKVVAQGTTIELPTSEEEYKKGLHLKVAPAVVDKVVVGVWGLVALAMWVGRAIKIAHKHAMRIVFRGESDK